MSQAGEPTWVAQLAQRLEPLSTVWEPSGAHGQAAAVLALLSLQDAPDLVLTMRAADLAHHAGQISLPGGRREPGDQSPSDTALRETHEEIGLPPSRVHLIGQMRPRELTSANRVIPVVGVWSGQEALAADGHEVELIIRWPISLLAAPDHRLMARHPIGGHGPAWQIDDLFLWGFTGYLVDALIHQAGWEQDWDKDRTVEVPARFRKP